MVIPDQFNELAQLFKVVLKVMFGEVIFDHLDQVCVPVPETQVFKKCGELQHKGLADEIKTLLDVILNVSA